MKKNTNSLFLSALIPLATIPVIVISACANETSNTKVFSFKSQIINFTDLSEQSANSYANPESLKTLIVNKKAEIFDNPLDDLNVNHIVVKEPIKTDLINGQIVAQIEIQKDNVILIKQQTITFNGFKKEAPVKLIHKIILKSAVPAKEFLLSGTGITDQPASVYDTDQKIKTLIIKNKTQIFNAEIGSLPNEQTWWEQNLFITRPAIDVPNGKITFNLALDNTDTTNTEAQTLSEQNLILKGFKKPEANLKQTITKPEVSSITLGLNGNKDEIQGLIETNWIAFRAKLIFASGFDLIKTGADLVEQSISWQEIDANSNLNSQTTLKLKFEVASEKWYNQNGQLGQTNKAFEINIKDLSATPTTNTPLTYKTSNDLQIGLVDPDLSKLTYEQAKTDAGSLFNDTFIFAHRMNLLSGDFSKILSKENLIKNNQVDSSFIDDQQKIGLSFTIPKEFVINPPNNNDIFLTINLSGFANQ